MLPLVYSGLTTTSVLQPNVLAPFMYNKLMHYFPNRHVAGDLIADQLEPGFRYEDCAVIALGDGAVLVGAQIAVRLHCVLTMLLSEAIMLPNDPEIIASIDQTGRVTYNDALSTWELEEIQSENFNFLEQQKLAKLFEINKLLGDGGVIDARLMRNRNVIIVSDGLYNGFSMHAAAEFLKPIQTHKIIMVTPFASPQAVDQMHVLADKIICLNVLADMFPVNHYYEDNKLPDHTKIVRIIEDIILHWQ